MIFVFIILVPILPIHLLNKYCCYILYKQLSHENKVKWQKNKPQNWNGGEKIRWYLFNCDFSLIQLYQEQKNNNNKN